MLTHSFFNKTESGQLGQEIEEKDFDAEGISKRKTRRANDSWKDIQDDGGF